MKKIISILVVCLLQSALAVAASFNLKVELTPEGAGTLNTSGGSYEEGSKVNLRTYSNTGYVFLGWYEGDVQLSTATSFSYVMPAHDAVVTARYEFDPAVPADPDSVGTQYMLTLECKPDGGGSFNTRSASIAEGDSVRLYAYTNTGYKFLQWEDEQGKVISTAQNFYYVMPHGNRKIYGVFDFDPEPPSNPSKNYWNEETGEVIIDDFTPGRLSDALSSAIGYASRDQVTMITVVGVMTSNDFGIANYYENCTLLDLSRVTGITTVPSYAFDYTNLESVFLPSTIETIGNRAFYGCSHLASLTIYAMIPPTLGSSVFTNVPEGLVIYVPAASIGLYLDAEGWSNYTILPIQEDVHNLNVCMPEACDVSLYRNNVLELTNKQNGQCYKAIITEQSVYSFPYLIKHTKYDLKLLNSRNMILGAIEDISIEEKDTVVTFSSLLHPKEVSLVVLLPDNRDVTNDVAITWKDERGNYLCSGSVLDNVVEGYSFTPCITLPKELALEYVRPADTSYLVTSDSNQIRVTLTNYSFLTFSGKVLSNTTQMPLEGIQVSVTQMIDGKYVRTEQTLTSSEGLYLLTVIKAPAIITYSSDNFHATNDTIDFSSVVGKISLDDKKLQPISGFKVGVSFTFIPSSDGNGNVTPQILSLGGNDVNYEITNQTKGIRITNFITQYPLIVLPHDTEDGDSLLIKAKAANDAFLPVTVGCKVSKNGSSVVFPFLELGCLKAICQLDRNNELMGILYDVAGKLIRNESYTDGELVMNDIVDGEYLFVTMTKSKLFNSISRLDALSESGLEEGKDYLLNKVTLQSGKITIVENGTVPIFDDSCFSYTSSDAYFSVNKASSLAGSYLTMQACLAFKKEYIEQIENVRIVVELSDGTAFIDNSVIIGNEMAIYELDHNNLTIPVDGHLGERIRFCIMPEMEGVKTPTAYALFTYNDKEIKQPLGSVTYNVQSMAMNSPSIVCTPKFVVSGVVMGGATVDVYDGNMLIGNTKALANGVWKANCELSNPRNLSSHVIHAVASTKIGAKVKTETKQVLFDKSALEVSKVHMYHWNPEQNTNYDVVYDFQNPSQSAQKYVYYIYNREFTFTIDFTSNDTTRISDVKLRVKTGNDSYVVLDANYSSVKNCWVASGEFGNMYDGVVPRNVDVYYVSNNKPEVELDGMRDLLSGKSQEELANYKNAYLNIVENSLSLNDKQVCDSLFVNTFGTYEVCEGLFSDAELEKYSEEELIEMLNRSISEISSYSNDDVNDKQKPEDATEYDFVSNGYRFVRKNCEGLDSTMLIQKGFMIIPSTDGFPIFSRTQDGNYEVVDFTTNTHLAIYGDNALTRRSNDSDENVIQNFANVSSDNTLDMYFSVAEEVAEMDKVKLGRELRKAIQIEKMCEKRGFTKGLEKWAQNESNINNSIEKLGKSTSIIKGLGKVVDLYGKYKSSEEGVENTIDTWNLQYYLPDELPVTNVDYDAIQQLKSDIRKRSADQALARVSQYGAQSAIVSGVLWSAAICPWSLIVTIPAALGSMYAVDDYFNDMTRNVYNLMKNQVVKYRERIGLPPLNLDWQSSGVPDNDVSIDPSGYIYEGVFSNRVEGATATVFYKETIEDMFGDKHENIVKWDANEYAQENPLFTDANGYYRWDVPQGLWQVKFEKEGYETAYSEWLPVPPPQLDVNIAMRQNVPPTVKTVHAYEESVEMEFDKYMMPEQLNNYNITVIQDGKPVEGIVSLLNEEASYENSDETYASKVRFNAAQPFTAQEVTLMVSNRVKSYAGIRMQDDFSQTFTVEREIKQIVSDSLMVVGYGETTTFTVSVLPALASQGKTLTVKTSSPMILGVKTEQVTIDNNGNAEITVSGELPGTAALTFSIEGTDKSAVTVTTVEKDSHQLVAMPTASITTGSIVEEGTQIELYCSTEGATIYYTTDGSCPCNETGSRKVYDGTPIIIYETTTIKAIAVAPDMTESDIAEFTYIVDGTGIKEVTINGEIQVWPLPVHDKLNVTVGGKTIKNVSILSMNGVIVASSTKVATKVTLDVSKIPTGIYIINVTIDNGTFSRKILKVE